MSMGIVLKIYLTLLGLGLAAAILDALARRKMTEVYSIPWVLFSVFLIITGLALHPVSLGNYISWHFFLLLLAFVLMGVLALFRITEHMSEFMRRSTEMEIQVSLLNEENRRLNRILAETPEKNEEKDEEENTVCHQYDGHGRSGSGGHTDPEAD